MKTYKHLYRRIGAFENLYAAFRKARRGKRSRPDVAWPGVVGIPTLRAGQPDVLRSYQ